MTTKNRSFVTACCQAGFLLLGTSGTAALAEAVASPDSPESLDTVVVTARLRQEDAQSVPISMTVVDAGLLEQSITYNVAQLTQLAPSLNFVSPNPRNTALTIRGLGSSVLAVAQSNDGLEPGVGYYVDGVYHARPATAAFDFTDLQRVEILRGPQGTLFGKNTTAGAINITTMAPSFEREIDAEASVANYGYYQGKGIISGALIDGVLAGRLTATTTHHDGVLRNVTVGGYDNNLDNSEFRAQLLYTPSDDLRVRVIADYSSYNAQCCTQVYYGFGTTLKPAAQQYPALAAGLHYTPASLDPYARLTDIDATVGVGTNEGGLAAIADWQVAGGTLTSVSAWRYWNWDANNDRDYTALSIQTLQHIPSRQDQYSQELRYAKSVGERVDYVAGLYYFSQTIIATPITQYGPMATYWLLGPPPTYPSNLLDGYGTKGHTRFHSDSYAGFGEAVWHVTSRLAATLGLRFTDENKDGQYSAPVYGGLATTVTSQINAQLKILRPQAYTAVTSDASPSGRVNVAYSLTSDVMAYANYANASKSGGINMSGLPLTAANQPALATAVIKPEHNQTAEVGVKSTLLEHRLTLDVDAFDTVVRNFQTNVVDSGPGALRGYLANIDKVRVEGAELDGALLLARGFTARLAGAWMDGKYVSYANGPCPLELIGTSTTVCNLSGKGMSGLPRWTGSLGGEYEHPLALAGASTQVYLRADYAVRSWIYGDPSDSKYTHIPGYGVVNASLGLREGTRWDVFLWTKNLFARDYMQNLTVQAGNSGLILGTPSDPREVGVTLRAKF